MAADSPRLPNFFVVGAEKAGTTSLYHYLKAHPQIYMCPIKEPCHFSKDYAPASPPVHRPFLGGTMRGTMHNAHVSDLADYVQLYRNAKSEIALGECSPSYLFSACAARAIRAVVPHARIIILLRNPVERAYSHYLMDVRLGDAYGSFREELDADRSAKDYWGMSSPYVFVGMYYEQVKRYFEVFARDQIKLLFYEDMRSDPAGFVKAVYRYLGVSDEFLPARFENYYPATLPRFRLLNFVLCRTGLKEPLVRLVPPSMKGPLERVYSVNKVPEMPASDRRALIAIFEPDVRKLESLVGRDLSSWLR